jgi:hypothetical protein
MTTRRFVPLALAGALLLPGAERAQAQNPDLILSQAERDSILKTYDNKFPIWGRKAIERGFDLPYSSGLNLNFVYMSQDILIRDIALSTGDNPTVPVDIVQFGQVKAPVYSMNLRADLWVLPFLNVYVFGGHAWVTTDVTVTEPISLTTVVEQEGVYGGVGMTATIGVKRNWLAFDLNSAWTQTEKLDQPVQGRIFGIRYGRAFKLTGPQRMAVWVGASKQTLKSETVGSIALSEVIDGDAEAQLRTMLPAYQRSAEYQQLPAAQRQVFDSVAAGVLRGDLEDVTINYGLNKAVADPWNMLLGISWEKNKRWQARVETGFIGRVQVLLMANYRFQI